MKYIAGRTKNNLLDYYNYSIDINQCIKCSSPSTISPSNNASNKFKIPKLNCLIFDSITSNIFFQLMKK